MEKVSRGNARLNGIKLDILLVIGGLMVLALLVGCNKKVQPSTAPNEQTATAKGQEPISIISPTGKPIEPANHLLDKYMITIQQMGPAHLGMTVKQLKQTLPGATYRIGFLPDVTSAIAVRLNAEVLFYFTTRRMDAFEVSGLPSEDDVITFIITKNSRFTTRDRIRPGSPLEEAVAVYGPAELYYSPDAEYASFKKSPASEMGFWVVGPRGKESAGVYNKRPENLVGGYYKTTRFIPKSKILYISIAAKTT